MGIEVRSVVRLCEHPTTTHWCVCTPKRKAHSHITSQHKAVPTSPRGANVLVEQQQTEMRHTDVGQQGWGQRCAPIGPNYLLQVVHPTSSWPWGSESHRVSSTGAVWPWASGFQAPSGTRGAAHSLPTRKEVRCGSLTHVVTQSQHRGPVLCLRLCLMIPKQYKSPL